MKSTGICYLVGAGPGDPGLFTLRGKACLERADVVIYDYLSNPELLRFAPASAEKIYAGKKANQHTLTQDEINALLVEKTKAGRTVVRLKGGDPFIFGRGGEEAEALATAKLKFEVVPGVTSAIAGPAYAGIPVTHRDHNTAVTFFTGHEDPTKGETSLDFAALAQTPGTKVMLMGVERIAEISRQLQAHGLPAATPIALTRWATTGRQESLISDLANVANRVIDSGFKAPAIAVIGEVVKLRTKLNWFETKPLYGKRIAVTRTRKQAGDLIEQLRELGADAYELPTIRIEPPSDVREFYELVAYAHSYDWLVFTSPNGVDAFFEAFFKIYKDARELGGVKIAAIGPATAARVEAFHLQVDLQPEKYVAEAVIKAFREKESIENLKVLLARAENARDVLPIELAKMGAIVDEVITYRTVPETDAEAGIQRYREEGADLVTFTSSSTAENFEALKLGIPKATASIGPITTATLKSLQFPVTVEAKSHDIPGLVAAIAKHWSNV